MKISNSKQLLPASPPSTKNFQWLGYLLIDSKVQEKNPLTLASSSYFALGANSALSSNNLFGQVYACSSILSKIVDSD
jgi:hypothetical protein